MCVDPQHRTGTVATGHAAERAHRDRVVAAEDERQRALARGVGNESGEALADLENRGEVVRVRVAGGGGSGTGTRTSPGRRHPAELTMRSASSAYLIADGPMSTPRRPAPRSSPAPMTATGRGVSGALTGEDSRRSTTRGRRAAPRSAGRARSRASAASSVRSDRRARRGSGSRRRAGHRRRAGGSRAPAPRTRGP